MQRIARKDAMNYEFNKNLPPSINVDEHEEFIVETEDALSGKVRTEKDLPVAETFGELLNSNPVKTNPVTNPIYVNGAEPGDVLAVEIVDIIPDKQGVTCIIPGIGPLKDSHTWAAGRGPSTHIIKHLPGPSGTTSDGTGILNDRITWKLHPFIGTIATMPEREIRASVTGQGTWGGNIDVRDVCKGNIVYLSCAHKGGLLCVGDVHGSQGDTEFTGLANETRSELRLKCSVIKQKTIPFVRIEKSDSIIQLNSYRPLEDCVKQAIFWLMEWLVEDYNMDRAEAYIHMTANPDVRVNVYQMVAIGEINYTAGVEFPKKYLK